jgi:hypothetical protein
MSEKRQDEILNSEEAYNIVRNKDNWKINNDWNNIYVDFDLDKIKSVYKTD